MTIAELREALEDAWHDYKEAQKMGDREGVRIACARSNRYAAQLTAALKAEGVTLTEYQQQQRSGVRP
jgi:hypothetical protein